MCMYLEYLVATVRVAYKYFSWVQLLGSWHIRSSYRYYCDMGLKMIPGGSGLYSVVRPRRKTLGCRPNTPLSPFCLLFRTFAFSSLLSPSSLKHTTPFLVRYYTSFLVTIIHVLLNGTALYIVATFVNDL